MQLTWETMKTGYLNNPAMIPIIGLEEMETGATGGIGHIRVEAFRLLKNVFPEKIIRLFSTIILLKLTSIR